MRRINFTGSTRTGRLLAEAAGRNLKRVVLELGGYNPLLVLADADLDYAVNAAAFGAFLHQGQICMSARKVIVERSIADEFTSRLAEKTAGLKAGDPNGARHDHRAADQRRGARDGAGGASTTPWRTGAKVLAGRRGGRPVLPGDGARRRARGLRVRAAARRSARCSRSRSSTAPTRPSSARTRRRYGLSAGIITSDTDRGFALAQRLESGIVHVNDQPVGDEPQMPFGGVKDSGWGRFGGQAVIDEFTELRWITVQSGTHPFPF